jgi:nucleoid-associated protein YgaU
MGKTRDVQGDEGNEEMRLGIIAVIVVATVFSVPITADAYTAKTESSDEEYVSERAAEAAAEAEASKQEQSPSVSAEHSASETGGQGGPEKEMTGPTVPICVVPDLHGDSVNRARGVLRRRHCDLGRVVRRRGSKHGVFVVVRQEIRAGTTRPAGTRVAVTVGAVSRGRS